MHAQFVLIGAADHVADSHISNVSVTDAVYGRVDQAIGSMHWTPSIISLALIAYSAYTRQDLSLYQKSKQAGARSVKSYVAYLAGGVVALSTGTWWIGMISGIGTRMVLGSGRKKRDKLATLREVGETNKVVLRRLSMQVAKPY